jgi:hypothetical protein
MTAITATVSKEIHWKMTAITTTVSEEKAVTL